MTDSGPEPAELSCQPCGTSGPPGTYCTGCGSGFGASHRPGHPAAPNESVLLPSVVTSLFPRLEPHARRPFRVALITLLVVLGVAAMLRGQASVVGLAALGFALLFTAYLVESDVFHEYSRRVLAFTAILGAAMGAAWAALSGRIVSRMYDVPLVAGPQIGHVPQAMALATVGALLMLVPALVVAFRRPGGTGSADSLDGYVVGALGATFFITAGTVVRLAPQMTSGPTTELRSPIALLVEAGIQGLAVPLTAAAAGGLFGLALWFRDRSGGGVNRWAVLGATAIAVTLYCAQRLTEIIPLRQGPHLGLDLLIAGIALLVTRFGVRWALLHEAIDSTETMACPECGPAEPGARFCGHCGVALRTFSRAARSGERPGNPAATRRRVVAAVGIGGTVLAAGAFGVSAALTAPPARYVCPPDCGAPPIGEPVATNPQFTSADGDFTVSYPGPGTVYRPTFRPNGVGLDFIAGDTGTLELHGEAAQGRDPKQVAEDLLRRFYPDATVSYEIPNASVGYQPGYGVVADDYPQGVSGMYTRLRILLVVAVKNDYALAAGAVGPYHEFSPSFGNGHPSGANLQLALDMAKYVNSFMWRGDTPR